MLHIVLLGQPQIRLNGVPLHFSTAKAQTLLYYLIVLNKSHSRTALAGLLWGELPETSARRNLRVELNRLRRQLADYLIVTRTTLAFNRQQPYWLDIDQLPHSNEAFETMDRNTLEQSLALYRGPFLEDISVRDAPEFELWILQRRERLAQRVIAGLKWLAHTFEQTGDYKKALIYANRWLGIESWNEDAHTLVMRLHFATGERSAALAQFEQCKQILAETLGIEPSPEIMALYQQIQVNRSQSLLLVSQQAGRSSARLATSSTSAVINEIPIANPFVGRKPELDQINTLFKQKQSRLITILGPGGIGKTRLALEVMPRLTSLFADGVHFVSLTALGNPERLAATIAVALSLTLNGVTNPQLQLLNFLRHKQLLLVLDNFEHLVANTDLLLEILEQTATVRLIVTSRVALGVVEESIIGLNGLSLPETKQADTGLAEAPHLFIERAKRVHLHFDAEQESAGIKQICRLVDGLPLGIELAAVWVRVLSCTDIITEIKRNLDFLKTELPIVSAHQHSLRAVFNYSWSLLPTEAQTVFRYLTVFQGGFTRAAAEAVADASLRMLSTFIDRSFLQRTSNGRYQAHELVRQFAAEKLNKAEQVTIAQAHSTYFAQFMQGHEANLMRQGEPVAIAEVAADIENIRLGWQWAISQSHYPHTLGYVKVLAQYFIRSGLYQEGYDLLTQAIAAIAKAERQQTAKLIQKPGPVYVRACLTVNQALIGLQLSMFDQVKSSLATTLPHLEKAEDEVYLGQALTWLGYAETRTADYQQAENHLQASLNIYQGLKDNRGIATALTGLAMLANSKDDYIEAEELCLTTLAIYQDEGYLRGSANLLSNLGTTYARRGNTNQAQYYYEQALDLVEQINEPQVTAVLLSNLGSCARAKENFDLALAHLHQSLALFQQMGDRRWIVATRNLLGLTLLSANRATEAKTYLIPALQEAIEIQAISDALDCLPLLCRLLLADHRPVTAMLGAVFTAQHAITRALARTYALEVQEQAKQTLSTKMVDRVRIEAKTKTLTEVTDLVLDVLMASKANPNDKKT